MDRTLDCYAKGHRFKTHLGLMRVSYFYRNFVIFSTFLQNDFLSNETATPQTNIGLYNIRSEMLAFKVIAQGCRIPGSGGAQAPPVFRTLSHKNAIKPKNLRF